MFTKSLLVVHVKSEMYDVPLGISIGNNNQENSRVRGQKNNQRDALPIRKGLMYVLGNSCAWNVIN
jgi:hypothetical protein